MINRTNTSSPISFISTPIENNSPVQKVMTHQNGSNSTATGTMGLIDGKQNYKRNQNEEKSSSVFGSRLWMILSVIFILTSLTLVGLLLWREFGVRRETKRDALALFPSLFRTQEEQQNYAARVFKIQREEMKFINKSVITNESCNFDCRPLYGEFFENTTTAEKRQKRAVSSGARSGLTYHACCISETKFISPNRLENIFGISRNIVQFKDKRQFFQIQECSQARNCYGCSCASTVQFISAVVENEAAVSDDDMYMLDIVKVSGCCKCINRQFEKKRKRSVLTDKRFWTKWTHFVKHEFKTRQ